MAELNAYLRFNGNCREAMEFYRDCLGGTLSITPVKDSPIAKVQPPEMQDKIAHSALTNGSTMLMGADNFEKAEYRHGNDFSLSLICKSKQEIELLFSKFSAGATAVIPLQQAFFGTFGRLTDKYGFSWLLEYNEAKVPEAAASVQSCEETFY